MYFEERTRSLDVTAFVVKKDIYIYIFNLSDSMLPNGQIVTFLMLFRILHGAGVQPGSAAILLPSLIRNCLGQQLETYIC